MPGALWVQFKTTGPVSERSARLAGHAWWGVVALTAIATAVTFKIQPQVKANLTTWPWGLVFPFVAIAGLAGVQFEIIKRDERSAFFASCAYLAGMLTSVVFGLYPMVLPARNPIYSLTVATTKARDYGLKMGMIWWSSASFSPPATSCTCTAPSPAKSPSKKIPTVTPTDRSGSSKFVMATGVAGCFSAGSVL
jgi:cytochrome bd-type quinol oxidase subunit 2